MNNKDRQETNDDVRSSSFHSQLHSCLTQFCHHTIVSTFHCHKPDVTRLTLAMFEAPEELVGGKASEL